MLPPLPQDPASSHRKLTFLGKALQLMRVRKQIGPGCRGSLG